jgi:trehalose 6-phosphate phosphatase
VISGRRVDDLAKRLQRVPLWHLVGDHGFESRGTSGASSAQVRGWVAQLRSQLPEQKGLVIEAKRNSITVHYRHVRDKRRVLELLAEAAHQLRDARTIYSPEAINFLPNRGAHKGLALQQACRTFACDTAIYVGDDDTDEDAFASAEPERLLSIRVGTKRPSIAQYRLKSQSDIDDLMQLLVELRKSKTARRS